MSAGVRLDMRQVLMHVSSGSCASSKTETGGLPMHEMSIVGNVVDAVVMYAKEESVERVVGVSLTVGALHDVVDDLMEKAFRFLARGTIAEGAYLKLNKLPLKVRCRQCHTVYEANLRIRESLDCPACGQRDVDVVQGREFLIDNIEVATSRLE